MGFTQTWTVYFTFYLHIFMMISGRGMTNYMTAMKERWIASNFTMTEQDLLKMIPELRETFSNLWEERKKSKQQKF